MREREHEVQLIVAEVLQLVGRCRHARLDDLRLPNATEAFSEQSRLPYPGGVIGDGDLLAEALAALRAGAGCPRLSGGAGSSLEQDGADRLELLNSLQGERRPNSRRWARRTLLELRLDSAITRLTLPSVPLLRLLLRDPLDVVARSCIQHPRDHRLVGGRRSHVELARSNALEDLAEPALHPGRRIDGVHERVALADVSVAVGCALGREDRLARRYDVSLFSGVEFNRPFIEEEELVLCEVAVRGGPPPGPTRQSSANIESPDSAPVTWKTYRSPGPQYASPPLVP